MKKIILFYLFVCLVNMCDAQNFTGQWKGSFVDNSAAISWGSNKCDYVIDLDVQGTSITGFSYTYFTDNGRKYYTICKLEGTVDLKKKYVEVTETERTKTNVPVEVTNSFQLHKLKWHREAGKEILEGNWQPAPGQDKSINGFGTTLLSKRQLTEITALTKKTNEAKSPFSKPITKADATVTTKKNTPITVKPKPLAKTPIKTVTKPIIKATPTTSKPIAKTFDKKASTKQIIKPTPANVSIKKDTVPKTMTVVKAITNKQQTLPAGFEKRNNTILQTVNVENEIVNIELYDNGEIDGDSVSLFYNGKVLLAHQKLTTQPIKLDLPVNNDEIKELVMYADNLGTIPPNTALMIVMDGKKRYEVRVTSDLKKSGTIRFVHSKKE
jgi:hypothetical protein